MTVHGGVKVQGNHIRLPSTREDRLAIEDERGNAVNPVLDGDAFFLRHLRGAGVALKECRGRRAINARLSGDVDECGDIADIASLGEIGLENRLHNGILDALLLCEPDEAVRVERVRRAQHKVMTELEARTLGRAGHLRVKLLGLFPGAEFSGTIRAPVHAFLRHVGVQFVRTPGYGELISERCHGEGLFKVFLGDVAPGANDIRNDGDLMALRRGGGFRAGGGCGGSGAAAVNATNRVLFAQVAHARYLLDPCSELPR